MVRLLLILALVLQALSPCARCESIRCDDVSCPPGMTCASQTCFAPCLPAASHACCDAACDSVCAAAVPVREEIPCQPDESCCDPACIALLCRFVPSCVVTRTDARTSGDADLDRALDALHASTPAYPLITVAAPRALSWPDAVDSPPLTPSVSRPVICVWIN